MRSMRRGCGRIGWGLLAYMLCLLVLSTAGQLVLEVEVPWIMEQSWAAMALNDLATYLLAPLALWVIIRPLPVADPAPRGVTPKRMGKLALESIGLMEGANLITLLLVYLLSMLVGRDLGNLLDSATADLSIWEMLLFMVILAPLCEEYIFRRLLLRRLLPMGENFAVVMTALAFSLFHCNLYQAVYAFAVGVLFASIVVKTGRLRYTILLHMMLNFLGSVAITALEPYETATSVFVLAVYGAMVVFFRDWKSLFQHRPSLPGCYRAAFTSGGMLTFVILFGILSVAVTFIV
jgi:membrane protease YdiL (CAAX protease family)